MKLTYVLCVSVIYAAQVGAVFRLNGNLLTGVDEQGNLNNKTRAHGSALVNVVSGVALHALGSLSNLHGDGGGKLDGAGNLVREHHNVGLTLDEVILNGLDDILAHAYVLVRLSVEEVVAHAVHIGELHLLAGKHNTLKEVIGGETQVVILFGGDAADGHLNVRSHAGRSLELAFTYNADITVVVHGVTFAELNNRNFCHNAREISRLMPFSQDNIDSEAYFFAIISPSHRHLPRIAINGDGAHLHPLRHCAHCRGAELRENVFVQLYGGFRGSELMYAAGGQFVGQSGTLEVGDQIDAISSATITSKAVTLGVNAALQCVAELG